MTRWSQIPAEVTARSASDRTDDWPFWMVWDGRLNVTARVVKALFDIEVTHLPFADRETAEAIAQAWNTQMGGEAK